MGVLNLASCQLTDEIQFEIYKDTLESISNTTTLENLSYATNVLGTLNFEGQHHMFGSRLEKVKKVACQVIFEKQRTGLSKDLALRAK